MATIKLILEDDNGTIIYDEVVSKYNTKENTVFYPVPDQAREFHDLVKATIIQVNKYYGALV